MERIAPVRKVRPVNVNLPPISTAGDVLGAIGATIEAMAQGDLTPDEASVIAGVLEAKRQAIETVDLEARLSAVEAGLSAWSPGVVSMSQRLIRVQTMPRSPLRTRKSTHIRRNLRLTLVTLA